MTRHSVQADMLELVTDTHRADPDQLTIGDALEAACYVCGGTEAQHPRPGTPSSTHNYWSTADAEAEFAADAARQGAPRYPNGTTSPEANYVATERPY